MLTLIFGLLKMQNLLERKNPIINTNLAPLAKDETFTTDLDDFNLALTVQNYYTNEILSDPRYIRWVA